MGDEDMGDEARVKAYNTLHGTFVGHPHPVYVTGGAGES